MTVLFLDLSSARVQYLPSLTFFLLRRKCTLCVDVCTDYNAVLIHIITPHIYIPFLFGSFF